MKLLLHYPKWNNRWIDYIERELEPYDVIRCHTFDRDELCRKAEKADVLFSMWLNANVTLWTQEFPEKKIISYLRRFEIWEHDIYTWTRFDAIDAMIFVSPYYKRLFEKKAPFQPKKTYLIPNGINIDDFPLLPESGSTDIAWVGQMKAVKNIPLAFQILLALPDKYKLHQIGLPVQESQLHGQLASYVDNLGINGRLVTYDPINAYLMPDWYKDKGYVLSTSLNEGNPNCLIEAMAMGIKPVIHNWPGAKEQFPEYLVYDTVDEAVNLIESKGYNSMAYREWVEERYSLDNFKKIHEVIDGVCS